MEKLTIEINAGTSIGTSVYTVRLENGEKYVTARNDTRACDILTDEGWHIVEVLRERLVTGGKKIETGN